MVHSSRRGEPHRYDLGLQLIHVKFGWIEYSFHVEREYLKRSGRRGR
jgi:hypothetical protein